MAEIGAKIVLSATETISKALAPATKAVESFQKAAGNMNAALQLGMEHAKKTTAGLTAFGNKLGNVGKSMFKGVTLPVVTGAGLATKAFADFEDSMLAVQNELQSDAFGATNFNEGMKNLSKEVISFAKTTPVALKDVTTSLQDMVSAGVPVKDAMQAVRGATKLSVISGTEMKTVTEGLVTAMNSFNISADHAEEVSGKFFIASKNGAVSVQDLSENMGRIGVTARNAGISLDEMLASVAVASNAGIKGGEAFSAMEQILKSVAKPSEDAKQGAKLLGMEWSTASLKAKGLTKFLGEVIQKADKLGVDRGQVFETMLGAGKGKDALAVVNTIMARQQEYVDTLGDISSATKNTTELNKAYETQSKSMTNQLKIAKNEFVALGVEIGQRLAPYVMKGIEAVRGIMGWFEKHPTIGQFALAIAGIAAVLGPVLIGISGLIAMVPAVLGGFTAISTLLGGAGGLIGILAALATWPVALGVAFVAAGVLIYKYWEPIKTFFSDLVDWFSEKIKFMFSLWDNMPKWAKIAIGAATGPVGLALTGASMLTAGPERKAPEYGSERRVAASTVSNTNKTESTVTLDFKNPPPGLKASVKDDKAGVVDFARGVQGL